mgnify:CR=1 FL=1
MLADFSKERSGDLDPETLERVFLYALLWSVAGILETPDRARVDAHLRTKPSNLPTCSAPDTVYEFRVDEASGDWAHWGSQIPAWEVPGGQDVGEIFPSLLVPTIDSAICCACWAMRA